MTKEELEKIMLKHVQANRELYKQNEDMIVLYDEYIRNITALFDFLIKKESNLFYTIVFAILVEIGFFSAEKEFDSDTDSFKELTIKPGLSIINGAGVCRNVAFFYDDVFKNLYEYPLKLCCLDTQVPINDDTKTFGNHVINLTLYHDAIYGFDIMNQCMFKAISNNKLTGLGFDYSLEYIPNGDLLLELTTGLSCKTDFNNAVNFKRALLEISSMRDVLTHDEYKKLVHEANEFISQRKKMLREFLEQNDELTHEIKKKMLLLK